MPYPDPLIAPIRSNEEGTLDNTGTFCAGIVKNRTFGYKLSEDIRIGLTIDRTVDVLEALTFT